MVSQIDDWSAMPVSSSSGDTHPYAHFITKLPTGASTTHNNLTQRFYRATSYICSLIFLGTIFLCAILRYPFTRVRKDSASSTVSKDHLQHDRSLSPEEMKLVPDLNYYFGLYDLQVDKYDIITEDGFVLTIQRIVDPAESSRKRLTRRPLLCLHGLLQSSGSFCSSGKDSLAYYFFQKGYDVWLGNNRCGFEPRHMHFTPSDEEMWDWGIVEMARFDLSAMIDHIVQSTDTRFQKVILVAHSQGTTQGFISLDSDRFGLCSKVHSFIALAPAVYGGPLLDQKLFIKVISQMCRFNFFFGVHSFLPIMMNMRSLLLKSPSFSFFSYLVFNFLFDWNDELWNNLLKGRHFLFSPVYVSVKLMTWWLNTKDGFKRSKSTLEHQKEWFNESTPPILLVVPQNDMLVDGNKLISHMQLFERHCIWKHITLENYSHLDVLWSRTVTEDVGAAIIEFLRSEV